MTELGDLNSAISYWHWLGLGIVLMTVEAFVPGAFFLGMGFSALIVGGVLFAFDGIDWKWQLFGFALLSAISRISALRLTNTRIGSSTIDRLTKCRGDTKRRFVANNDL